MNQPVLTNKDQFPTEEIIFSRIGKTKSIWEDLFQQIHTEQPELDEQWRYYNDGKSWLMKVTRKSKTIFWLSVIEQAFRVTFYFGDKAGPALMESTISGILKKEFKEGKRYGKIRGITIIMDKKKNIRDVMELIKLKKK